MQPQISFLSQEEQEHIHQTALWVLDNVGMQMPSPEAVDIMQKAGAKIDRIAREATVDYSGEI